MSLSTIIAAASTTLGGLAESGVIRGTVGGWLGYDPSGAGTTSGAGTAVNAELERLEAQYRAATADALARAGSGATSVVSNAVGGTARQTAVVPISTNALIIGGAVLVALLLWSRQ